MRTVYYYYYYYYYYALATVTKHAPMSMSTTCTKSVHMTAVSPPATVKTQAMASMMTTAT